VKSNDDVLCNVHIDLDPRVEVDVGSRSEDQILGQNGFLFGAVRCGEANFEA
jgi:hypothetical protein